MKTDSSSPGWGRSILAVVAGFLACAVLSTAADIALHAAGVYPPWGQAMSTPLYVLAFLYRFVFTVLGAYVTGRLAPRNPIKHIWALGIFGVIAATAGTVATWNAGPEFGPKWYPISLVVTTPICMWLGALIALRPRVMSAY